MKLKSFENSIRIFIYKHFVQKSKAPTVLETAKEFNVSSKKIIETFNEMKNKHILVLDSNSCEIRMAMPFSTIPTAYKVVIGESSWWAN